MFRKNVVSLSVLIFVTACGGGSGGGTASGSSPDDVVIEEPAVLPTPLVPTARFQEQDIIQITSSTFRSVLAASNLNDFSTGFVGGFGSGLGSNPPANTSQQQFGPIRSNCTYNGYTTLSYFLVDISDLINGQFQESDSLESIWSNCQDISGFTFNGGFDFEVNEFSGDFYSDQYILDIDFILDNFSAEYNLNNSFNIDGDLNSRINTMNYPAYTSATYGNNIRVQNEITSILKDFSITVDNSGIGSQSITGEGFIDNPVGGDIIKFTIVEALNRRAGEDVTSGRMIVWGANNSSVIITIDYSGVQIEIDLDGDGIYEDSYTTTIDSLTAPLDTITVLNASYISEAALVFAEGMHYMYLANAMQFQQFIDSVPDAYAGDFARYTVACEGWGDAEFDYSFTDNNSVAGGVLASGDRIRSSWDECGYLNGKRYSGGLIFEVVDQSGNFNTADYQVAMSGYLSLLSSNNHSIHADGYQFTLTERAATDQQVHFTSEAISFGISDNITDIDVFGANTDGVVGISGTGRYIAYGQVMSISITESVVVDQYGRPASGTIVVVDPHGSTITITAIGDADYQLDVDIDGDEVIDSTFIKYGY